MLRPTDCGLFCEAGGFYVDPWRPVERAVITHGHTDHAHWGCAHYLCSPACAPVLRTRLGADISVQTAAYGAVTDVGGVRVSLHPAGHVLGSAQVRLEHAGQVWVVSGDYKLQRDPTADPFEPVPCDTFITESTFGLPIFRWDDPARVADEINRWWAGNIEAGKTSVIYAYALGKAQRVLRMLDASLGPILLHGAVAKMMSAYAEAGVALPRTEPANVDEARRYKGRAMVIAPPSAQNTPWLRKFAPMSTATASGWMRIRGTRRWLSNDRGFVLSDHADWPGLLEAINATGARRVGVTHGYTEALSRWLRERGTDAFIVPTRFKGEAAEDDAGTKAAGPDEPGAPTSPSATTDDDATPRGEER
jgi:putative mRNA 3-end processing factor